MPALLRKIRFLALRISFSHGILVLVGGRGAWTHLSVWPSLWGVKTGNLGSRMSPIL